MGSYDLKDLSIRNMVMQEHQPTEIRKLGDEMEPGVRWPEDYDWGSDPRCKTCQQSWPCLPITSLRDYDREQQVAHFRAMAETSYKGEMSPW